MSKFQLADMNNGAFGDVYETIEAAEKALSEEIATWQAEDEKLSEEELGMSLEDKKAETAAFFCIVDADSKEEV